MFFKNKFQKKALDKLPKREGAPCFLSFNEAKTVIFIFDLEEDKIICLIELTKTLCCLWPNRSNVSNKVTPPAA